MFRRETDATTPSGLLVPADRDGLFVSYHMHVRDNKATVPIAAIALNVPLRRTFDYLIPKELRGRIPVGGRVKVPFGRRKGMLGYCVELKESTDVEPKLLREITSSLDEEPIFMPRMLELTRWMADYYHCAWGEALHAAVPAAVRSRRGRRKLQFAVLRSGVEEALRAAQNLFDKSPAQSKLLRTLALMGGRAPVAELKRATATSRASLKVLERERFVTIEKCVVEREEPLAHVQAEQSVPHELTAEQRRAYNIITGRVRRGGFGVVLLHGVTSSGKTEVYLQSIAELLKMGKQAIVLVPEISLTPQTVRRFGGRFERLAVLHSRLTESERRAQWHRIRTGEVDVVVGARSAIFAPVLSLGMLVIDEEHEPSFKQESTPRYHARDVGIMRAKMDDALVVLGTATPSLESHHNGQQGKYITVRLTRRIGDMPLPPVEVIDMRGEWSGRARPRVISRRLEACVRESLAKGEQVILFVNRRGFSPFIRCPRCGHVVTCERCDITLTYHRGTETVACHYCGLERRPPSVCPQCGEQRIQFGGTGTERIEAAVQRLFPGSRSIRMDSDTMKGREAHEQALDAFRIGEAAILVGTQMIAKGLDFPNVTTVGVVNADVALHLPDFRSRERTFQLLAQVAGRTGRGPRGGRVIVQTFLPEDPSITAAVTHDYEKFARLELPLRRSLRYPPFARMARIVWRGRRREAVEQYGLELGETLRRGARELADGTAILGPAPAPVAQVKHRTRYHAMIKSPGSESLHRLLDAVGHELTGPPGVKVIVDVDPVSML